MSADSRTPVLPRVGAKIRVTRVHESGATAVYEFVATGVEKDWVGDTQVHGAGIVALSLLSDYGWTVTWEELAAPVPAPVLPAEPGVGAVVRVACAGSVVPRYFERLDDGWYGVGGGLCAGVWADVCAFGDPVPLVAAPLLTELVDALRQAVTEAHNLGCAHDVDFPDCRATDCEHRRALLARVQAGGAA